MFLNGLLALFILAVFFAGYFQLKSQRRFPGKKKSPEWGNMTEGLFQSSESDDGNERLERVLKGALRRLELGHGILTLGKGENLRVLSLVSEGYGRPPGIANGQEIPRRQIFSGELRCGRDFLAIDFASLSDWRRHPSYRDLGWECFIGARLELSGGEDLTLGFFHSIPRDQLFHSVEKEFVKQTLQWIAAIVEKERGTDEIQGPLGRDGTAPSPSLPA